MIGFKELVQNLKDGMPELKDIGKEGLGILGGCAKVAGEFALEGAKATGRFAAECGKNALGSNGLKLTESNGGTVHKYTDWTMDDVRSDRDYRSMFKRAMEEVSEKRKYDDYVTACTDDKFYGASVFRFANDKMVLWRLRFKGIRICVGTEVREESRDVLLFIQTANARQLAWNGDALQKDYEVSYSGQRGETQYCATVNDRFESFLGIVFCRDCNEFALVNQTPRPYDDESVQLNDVEAVNAKANKFLEFTDYQAIIASSALTPEWKRKTLGVVCSVSSSAVGDVYEFKKKVRAVLQHKYHGTWSKEFKSCGILGLGTEFLHYAMSVGDGKIYLGQGKDDVIRLKAVAGDYGKYREAVESAYKETEEYKQKLAVEQAKEAEKERVENERKAERERREQARKDALVAMAKKREEEEAAKKAELSDALDAL